jgi:hypothetical protein
LVLIALSELGGPVLCEDDTPVQSKQASSTTPAAKSSASSTQHAKPAQSKSAAPEAIDRQPYKIELHLALDPSARIDRARLAVLLKQWQALVRRLVGSPWIISIAARPSPLSSADLEALDAGAFAKFDAAFDKIWLVRISSSEPTGALVFTGREYDTATRRLEPLQEHKALVLADAPRALLQFVLELFNPTALITGQEGGRALLLVRGASITPASELGAVAAKGTVFVPLRLVTMVDNSIAIRRILFTYLQVEAMQGPTARCAIVTALRDPLTQRVSRPNTLAALGIKPGNSTIPFRFVTRPDLAPAAGYTLSARTVPDGLPTEVGMTDRAGRIALKPGFAKSLVVLRLLAANAEPMVEFPVMPGESSEARDIPIDPKPLTVSYQVQLDALRDEVIDVVAIRARLEKRLEARLQGEDYAGIEQGLKEYVSLPRREVYSQRLASLKAQAAKEQAQTKSAVLTKNIQARFNDLQALIDRYLDDEAFTSFSEALERKRSGSGDPAKAKTKARAESRRAPAAARPAPLPKSGDETGKSKKQEANPAPKPVAPKASEVPF